MTKAEFDASYSALSQAFPEQFDDKKRTEVGKLVCKMSGAWFQSLVNRMVRLNKPLSIADAVNGELKAQAALERTSALLNNPTHSAGESDGLAKALEQFGASSIWEAVEKAKYMPTEPTKAHWWNRD